MTTTVNPPVNPEVDLTPTILETPDGRTFELSTRIRPENYAIYEAIGAAGLLQLSEPEQKLSGIETRTVFVDTTLKPGTVLDIRKWLQEDPDIARKLADASEEQKVSLVEQALAETSRTTYGDDADAVVASTPQAREPFGDKLKSPADFRSYMMRQTLPRVGEDMDTGERPYPQNK